MNEGQIDLGGLTKIFEYIEGQFKHVAVHCEVETERLSWRIKVTVEADVDFTVYKISRVTQDLMDHTDAVVLSMVNGLVYMLKRAMCEEVFSNPDAPHEID